MEYLMARYKVKPDKLEAMKRIIVNFVHSVKANEPGTLLYEAYQEKDSTWFVHWMIFRDPAAQQAHEQSPYLKYFVEMLYPHCEETPVFTELLLLRSTREESAERPLP
jgi:quinol monooxygenase YgiN